MTGSSHLYSCVVRFTTVFKRMDIRDGVLLKTISRFDNNVYCEFFLNKQRSGSSGQ